MQLGVGLGLPYNLGKPAAGFSPLDLSPVLWLDAADTSTITEVGGAVSQWDDKSGNGNHVTQGTAAAQPTTGTQTINGLNVLDFDGGADFMTAGDKFDLLTGGITIMAVVEMDLTTGGQVIVSKDPTLGTGGYSLIARSSTADKATSLLRESPALLATESTTNPSTTPGVYGYRLRRDTVDGLQLWRDGSFVASATPTGTTNYDVVTDFRIGQVVNVNYFNGSIAEIVVVQSALSDTDMAALDNYLTTKWGV